MLKTRPEVAITILQIPFKAAGFHPNSAVQNLRKRSRKRISLLTRSNDRFREPCVITRMTEMRAHCGPAAFTKSSLVAFGPFADCPLLVDKGRKAAIRLPTLIPVIRRLISNPERGPRDTFGECNFRPCRTLQPIRVRPPTDR